MSIGVSFVLYNVNHFFAQLLIGQAAVLILPLVVFLLSGERTVSFLRIRKIKVSTALATVLFTFLIMPLMTLINAVSMLFVKNTVAVISGEVLAMPFFLMLLLIGIIGPLNEELVFRGILYGGLRKSGTLFMTVLISGLMFSVFHMNFNQAFYAFAIGIFFALLNEATGSIVSSVIGHIVINSWQVCLMYFAKFLDESNFSQESLELAREPGSLFMVIGVYMILAAVCTALAMVVLVWISNNEKREGILRAVWQSRKLKSERAMITVPLLVGFMICLGFMILAL